MSEGNLPKHWLPYNTVEEAEAAGYKSGTLANGDTFGDEDDAAAADYAEENAAEKERRRARDHEAYRHRNALMDDEIS